MKKLKLLFPLLGTSALAVAPALTAQANQSKKNNSFKDFPPTDHRISTDNNKTLFVNGKTDEYYYDQPNPRFWPSYTEANLTFTFTSAGSMALAKAETTTTHSTGGMIMAFLDKNLKHFDNGCKDSYLNEIEDVSNDRLMRNHSDGYAYSDFMNHMGQPASVVNQITDMYKKGVALPQIAVRFHYDWQTFAKDDFDVSFTIGNYPPSNLVPGTKNTLNPASFVGHFPGMGPYGKTGDQDHAELISSEPESETLKLDLSTASINYINNHYLNRPVSSVPLAVMDYLWKAYPSSDWKSTLSGILRAGGVNAVNYYFGKLVGFIGTYDSDGKTLLVAYPAYYYIKDGDSFTAAKNQPFS